MSEEQTLQEVNNNPRPKLLLADDSVTIRKVVELTFADEGVEVTTAADAEAAMAKFVEVQPDIVLVDVGMSGTSGYRICEMIKQDEATKHIPVLLLVGSFEPFDQDEAERVMSDGFLTKPFHSIRDLVNRVWDLLGRERRAAAKAAETKDIEELYNNSFAETARIEDFDTDEDMLTDSGMDDAMIEASYPSEPANGDLEQFLPPDGETIEPARQTKEFDWSTESLIDDSLPMPAIEPALAFEPKFTFDETPAAEPESVEHDANVDGESSSEDIAGTDPSEEIDVAQDPVMPAEPSPELISLLAQRVVERLSDKAIREIAQEAVPRIAEKLIREALEEDKNSGQ